MFSIHTNTAAMAALQTLRSIEKETSITMERLSTGYRVNSAKDNPAYWSIATTMRADIKSKSAVLDSLNFASAVVDTASVGMQAAIDIVSEIKAKLVLAAEPGADKDKINAELDQLKEQLRSTAESASFSGQNWLFNATGTVSIPISINSSSSSSSANYKEIDMSETNLIQDAGNGAGGILTESRTVTRDDGSTGDYYLLSPASPTGTEIAIDSSTTAADLEGMTKAIDAIEQSLIDANSTLGATAKSLEMQTDFTKKLIAVLEKGVGRLVDADMESEPTRMKALQTQMQLALQALSIANSQPSYLLQLFK